LNNDFSEIGLDAFVARYSLGTLPKLWALEAVVAALIELHPRKSELAAEIPNAMARMVERLNTLPLNPEGHHELAQVLQRHAALWVHDVVERSEATKS
jgi:hypothetical protein